MTPDKGSVRRHQSGCILLFMSFIPPFCSGYVLLLSLKSHANMCGVKCPYQRHCWWCGCPLLPCCPRPPTQRPSPSLAQPPIPCHFRVTDQSQAPLKGLRNGLSDRTTAGGKRSDGSHLVVAGRRRGRRRRWTRLQQAQQHDKHSSRSQAARAWHEARRLIVENLISK